MQYIDIPSTCPCCGKPTIVKIDPSSRVETLYCSDPANCGQSSLSKWTHFVKRDCMNIMGISEAVLRDMIDYCLIEDRFSDLFKITPIDMYSFCCNTEGYGEKSATNFLNAIEAAKNVELHNLIFAFGIPNIGLQTAKTLVKLCEGDLAVLCNPTVMLTKIYSTNGLGNSVATAWVDFLNSENYDDFREILNIVNIKKFVKSGSSMTGLVFCCTGAVKIYSNRTELQAVIESNGGKFTTTVSSNTNYLITNDTTSGSAKNKKAAELGIPILTEQQFIDKFDSGRK